MDVEGLTILTTVDCIDGLRIDGSLALPLTAHSIACVGFQFRHQELMSAMRGLDEAGIRAVLVCVIAERIKAERAVA